MADINSTKSELPFLLSGNGTLTVHGGVQQLNQLFTPSDTDLLDADFGAAGDQAFTFGAADTIKLAIKVQTKNQFYSLWPTSSRELLKILDASGLSDFFSMHLDQVVFVLDLSASVSPSVASSSQYSVLTESTTLDAGGHVGYAYLRPYVAATRLEQ